MSVQISDHARERWEERCSDLDFDIEYDNAVRLRSNISRVLRDKHKKSGALNTTTDRVYWYSRGSHVIFVMSGENILVTVMRITTALVGVIEHRLNMEGRKNTAQRKSKVNARSKRDVQEKSNKRSRNNRDLLNKYSI